MTLAGTPYPIQSVFSPLLVPVHTNIKLQPEVINLVSSDEEITSESESDTNGHQADDEKHEHDHDNDDDD